MGEKQLPKQIEFTDRQTVLQSRSCLLVQSQWYRKLDPKKYAV